MGIDINPKAIRIIRSTLMSYDSPKTCKQPLLTFPPISRN